MELTSFTFDEANEIWDDFEDLRDTEFNLGTATEYFVHDLVICPFEEADRLRYIERYDELKDSKQALEGYTGSDYDVMIIACDVADESVFSYVNIRTFITEKGISYNFPQDA